MTDRADVVVIGGSATGSSVAYHLLGMDPGLDVVVVEREPGYEHCSTLRSDGNLRVQFNLEENVRMSLYSFELLPTFADDFAIGDWRPDPGARHQGNLFMTDEDGVDAAMAGLELQRSLGCEVEWLEPDEIAARWPIHRARGIAGGTFGPRDGSIDPSAILYGLQRNAVRRGARYVAAGVRSIRTEGRRVVGVDLTDGVRIEAPTVVLSAGGWSTELAATAGVELPIEPVMRSVYVVQTPLDVRTTPSVFLPSGLYTLPEGDDRLQIAWSTDADPVGFDFRVDRERFEEVLWPELLRWMPAFDELRISSTWAGVYAMNTLDHNAILGQWPTLPGLYVAAGFSGHGFQHTPAMGRHIAELVVGAEPTLDLSRLGPQRVLDGVPVREHAGRII